MTGPFDCPSVPNTRVLIIPWLLIVLVAGRFFMHALYVPAFEGPDEPFHLARVTSFLDQPIREALAGETLSGDIAAAVAAHPCAPDLARNFGCERFGDAPAEFNVLLSGKRPDRIDPVRNYESHQPPLAYATGAALLFVSEGIHRGEGSAVGRLLMVRLFSVMAVIVGLMLLFRGGKQNDRSDWILVSAGVLLIPGAAESLARCTNDGAVFLWCALVVIAVRRKVPTWRLWLLVAVGPLIKLTALPIVVFAVLWLVVNRDRFSALVGAGASLVFLPVQYLRGWLWGGTVEFNAGTAAFDESAGVMIIGFVRSTYTFLKTTFWLGEWSFFRAPTWLLVAVAVLLGVIALSARRRAATESVIPYAGGLLAAAAATIAFFISHRLYWDQWGGVGGWYAWGWFPLIAEGLRLHLTIDRRRRTVLLVAGAVIIVVTNIAWFAVAHGVYGVD